MKNLYKPSVFAAFSLVFLLFLGNTFTVNAQSGTATVTTDKDDYAPGEYVIITGSGWEPGERVDFIFEETPKPETCVNSHDNFAIADANGDIFYDGFLIKENHIGVAFVLTATGLSSGLIATAKFTDGNVRFATSGLPVGTLVTVNFSYTKGSSTTPGTVIINSPGPQSAFTEQSASVSYTYPNTVSVGGNIYSLSSTYPGSSFNSGGNSTTTDVVGTYSLSCNPPSIGTSPVNTIVTYGQDAIFSVAATGSATLSYQWQVNTGSGWNNTSDSDGVPTTFTVVKPTISQTGAQYRVIVSNGCAPDATSNAATLTVNQKDITGSFTADNKEYDGNTSAVVLTRFLNGVIAPDAVTLTGGTATFSDANAALGKTVTLTGASLSGADAGNYNLTSVGTTTANISKAPSTTVVTIEPGSFTYTGSAITPASVSVTGAGGLSLTPDADYANNVNAGPATASYSYAGDANHEPSIDSEDFTIGKANAVITVTPYSVTYDGNAHTSVFTAVGVETTAADLTGLMDVSATTHTNAGDYTGDAWTFAGNGNYNAGGGTVDNAIGKADADITVTGYSGTYDALAHGATGTALGIEGETLAG
ncbi:YDG domain-containing protein, partial [Algoriphagus persicinus]|uniref:YDG domain-containing protein n=1 Tax=Algoriphagus persicinus TaxID=3108754 RepID=UPI002B3D17AA